MNEGIYYLRLNGKVEGPFTIGQIYDLWAQRKINSQTAFARFEEMDKWQPLSELTLKISSPKAAKVQTTDPAPAAPGPAASRQQARETRPALEHEALPAFLRQEQPPARSSRPRPDPLAAAKKIVGQPQFAAGACIIFGIALILYFAFLYPLTTTIRDSHDVAINKQSGIFTGVGLLLLAGLLLIVQQLSRLHSAVISKQSKTDSKSSNHS